MQFFLNIRNEIAYKLIFSETSRRVLICCYQKAKMLSQEDSAMSHACSIHDKDCPTGGGKEHVELKMTCPYKVFENMTPNPNEESIVVGTRNCSKDASGQLRWSPLFCAFFCLLISIFTFAG